jgi:serine/threonine-protein kinase
MQDRILAGRYRLVHQLGKGGMGTVWTAEHLSLHSAVAVKLLDKEIAKSTDAVERFRREAQAAATLRSAHVVQVLDYGVEDDTPYLVMELLQGEDLAGRLGRVGRLTPQALTVILQQVARAVGRAHDAGIVHRDLKPENIFLVNEGDHELVKVLDFGIAKAVTPGFAPSATRTGVTMGTPYYMSPEQAEGKREVDHRTDLWALGVIASECLTGVRPFDGETFGELLLNICARPAPVPSSVAQVPRYFDVWFAKATHRDPAMRFGNVHELVASFAEVAAGRVPAGLDSIPLATAPLGGPPPIMFVERAAARDAASTRANAAVTVGPDDPPQIPITGRGLVPLLLLGVVALSLAGVGGWWLTSRSSAKVELAAPSASLVVAEPAAPPAASNLEAAPGVTSGSVPTPPPVAPARAVAAARRAEQNRGGVPALVTLPEPRLPEPPKATSDSPKAPAPKPSSQRCVKDPFTGALKPAGAGAAGSVACQRNAFTGAYQRL